MRPVIRYAYKLLKLSINREALIQQSSPHLAITSSPIATEQRVLETFDAHFVEPLATLEALQHLVVPVAGAAAVAVGLLPVHFVVRQPRQRMEL